MFDDRRRRRADGPVKQRTRRTYRVAVSALAHHPSQRFEGQADVAALYALLPLAPQPRGPTVSRGQIRPAPGPAGIARRESSAFTPAERDRYGIGRVARRFV